MAEYKSDGVDHPAHYNNHPAGIECVDVVEHYNFNVGNAIKYLWRAGLKPGEDTIKDLEKAAWYVQREIKRLLRPKTINDIRLNKVACKGCAKAKQRDMKPENFDHTCGLFPAEGLVVKKNDAPTLPAEPVSITGVKHRRNNWGALPPEFPPTAPVPPLSPIVAEAAPELVISDIQIGEVAKAPEKKLQASAEPCGISEPNTAPNATALATYNKLTQQGPCAMCDSATWKSILRRNNGYCTKCKTKLTKEKITQEFAEERAAKATTDPKDELNDRSAAEYLFTLLKKKFPVRGDFLVADAMTLIDVSYPCAIKYLKILQRQGKLYTKSPHDLQDMQKWHITKDKNG